jgi:VanZ family protein
VIDSLAPRQLMLLVPPLVVMALIFYLSSQPSTVEYPAWEVVLRKIGHAGGYALLTFTWWRAFRGLLPTARNSTAIMAAVAVSLAYAASDEVHQAFVNGRHGTPVDVLIDSIGIAAVALMVSRRSRRPSRAAPGRCC